MKNKRRKGERMVFAEVNNVEFIPQVSKRSHGSGFQPVNGGIAVPLSERLVIRNPKYKSNLPTNNVEVIFVIGSLFTLTIITDQLKNNIEFFVKQHHR